MQNLSKFTSSRSGLVGTSLSKCKGNDTRTMSMDIESCIVEKRTLKTIPNPPKQDKVYFPIPCSEVQYTSTSLCNIFGLFYKLKRCLTNYSFLSLKVNCTKRILCLKDYLGEWAHSALQALNCFTKHFSCYDALKLNICEKQ